MKMWLKTLSLVLVLIITVTVVLLFTQEKKECCLCSSFRYHAPCLIDLETGKLIALDLYFPHETKVAELAEEQPETSIFFSVRLGNVSGTKFTGNKTIDLSIPNDKTFYPALCRKCKQLLPFGHTSRYIFADLYDKEEKVLIPIKTNAAFSLRCYDITTVKNEETKEISAFIRGTLGQ